MAPIRSGGVMKLGKVVAIAIAAVALPIGTPAAAVRRAPAYSLTGFYAGIAGRLASGQSQFIDADPTNLNGLLGSPITSKFDVSGGIVGGTVGDIIDAVPSHTFG